MGGNLAKVTELMANAFQIGPWVAEPSLNTLSLNGKTIHIEPKVMEVLVCLANHGGETISKEELLKRVWPATFVTDDVLTRCISELRRAFGDDPKESRFIKTIPKRGYRVIAPIVTDPGGGPSLRPTAPIEKSPDASQRRIANPVRRAALIGIAMLAVALSAVVFNVANLRGRVSKIYGSPKITSVAVLPLKSLSANPNQEYFSDGLTDALTTELSQISSIKVISRTTAERYRNTDKPLSQVADELRVDGVVEGTVQKSGDSIRVTIQLIYAPEDRHLWAKSYERDAQNVLALEQDIARAVAEEIGGTLTPSEKARLTRSKPLSVVSLEMYLQGRYYTDRAGSLAYRKGQGSARQTELAAARGFFEKAIQNDPTYAQAYVGLAKTWRDEPVSVDGPGKAERLLRKAIALDSDLAEAHEALATLDVLRLWRWSEAEQEYKRAIQLNPNSAEAHARYAEYLDCMKRFDEGMKEFLLSQSLDPGHDFNPNPFYRRREYDRAIEEDEGEVKRQAFGFWSHWNLAYDYEGAGRREDSAREWEQAIRMLGFTELANSMHRGLDRGGYNGALSALVAGIEVADSQGNPSPPFFVGMMYGFLGQKDRAFYWLERGYKDRSPSYSSLNVDPCWDPLRDDPRFKDLVRRVGLP
jgi:TolB-like protein/DNA-binding winged helix-turn-helix (wHTH) protein